MNVGLIHQNDSRHSPSLTLSDDGKEESGDAHDEEFSDEFSGLEDFL